MAAATDHTDYAGATVSYNGQATMRLKTKLALERASGLMIWTLEDDTADDTSLLKAIYDTIISEERKK